MSASIQVANERIESFACDVLVLKYAQGFHGADAAVAGLLTDTFTVASPIAPLPGEYVLLPGDGKIAAQYALFVGVPRLLNFGYGQIREFTRFALQIVAQRLPDARHIAMTMHGIGIGLDEREAFLSQLGGLVGFVKLEPARFASYHFTFVEKNAKRAKRLQTLVTDNTDAPASTAISAIPQPPAPEIQAGLESEKKPHVFVAMPFSLEMEDVFIFGIQGPVNAAGYLCERVDMDIFTGDIVARIRERIETAALVIADLTGANANVYLEVGYAWGKNVQTLLLTRREEDLKFDVKSQRCIIYKNISDLARKIEQDLKCLAK
jgi:hypothetical protein